MAGQFWQALSGVDRGKVGKAVSASASALSAVRLAMNRLAGRLGKQRRDDAARGAAGAEQQDALAAERDAEIGLDVAHQAGAVGVVAEDPVFPEDQRIDRAGQLGARRCAGR